jgi:uncharacterized protein YidB (DUF937 family)
MENAMSRGFPSMTALLGLLAVAGYQNRDKIAELISGLGAHPPQTPEQEANASQSAPRSATQGDAVPADVLGALRGAFGRTGTAAGVGGGLVSGAGGFLNNGLRELVERFTQKGQGEVAQSWINPGPNKEIEPEQLKAAIGTDVLAELAQRTGLAPEEVLKRLSRELPAAVDNYTPEGRLPA